MQSMSTEKELRILLEFMDNSTLPQSYFERQEEFGSVSTISKILNRLGDEGILDVNKPFKKSTHYSYNVWSLNKSADSFKAVIGKFLDCNREEIRFKDELLRHDYFWKGLSDFKEKIDLPLFWRLAKICLSREFALKFAISDINIRASNEWIPLIVRFHAQANPTCLKLTEEEVTFLQRLCYFPRVLENLIRILEENKWICKPISFFKQQLPPLQEKRKQEDLYRFQQFSEQFILDAFEELTLLSHQCQDECKKLLDLVQFKNVWVRSVFWFLDNFYMGEEEFPRSFSRIDKEKKMFCPQCRKPLILSFTVGLGILPDEPGIYEASVCGYCGMKVQYANHYVENLENSGWMLRFYPNWGIDKEIYFIRLWIEKIRKKKSSGGSFMAIGKEDAEKLGIKNDDVVMVRNLDVRFGEEEECLSYITKRLKEGIIVVFRNYDINLSDNRAIQEEDIWIYRNMKFIDKVIRKI